LTASLKVIHKSVGAEVRRGSYDVAVDGERLGAVEMGGTFEAAVEAGHHTVQVRDGRKLSQRRTFDAADGDLVAFRCTGKRFLPIFLASFIFPSLALSLHRD
jgi:hypothetical protein